MSTSCSALNRNSHYRAGGSGWPLRCQGPGRDVRYAPILTIANAIFDAVGVRVDSLPISSEKILRARLAKESSAAA
jgi:hypothetical protein